MKQIILLSLISALLLAGALPVNAQNYSKITYVHSDADGTPFAATDEQGNLEWQIDHYPYGDEYSNTEVARKSDISFAGKPYDEEIGLSYFGARWYDPAIGRFTGIDPVLVKAHDYRSFNRYSYGFNNPYRYVDPDGREPTVFAAFRRGESLDDAVLRGGPFRVLGTTLAVGGAAGALSLPAAACASTICGPIATVSAAPILTGEGTGGSTRTLSKPKLGSAGGPGKGKNFPKSVQDAERTSSGNKCLFCGVDTVRSSKPYPQRSNIDHAIPKSRGGNNTPVNAQNTCQTCNLRKGAKTTKEFLNNKGG